jgi:hypothetical protein
MSTKVPLKVTDLVDYPEKFFIEVKDILVKLKHLSAAYVGMDNLYDLEGLERLKRDMTAQLEFLAEHHARTKKFKTGGDYLEEIRKYIKSEATALISDEEKISVNQAEKLVYQYSYYRDRVQLMEGVKSFFIKVEVMYKHYQDVLSSVVQSIASGKKDSNYKYASNN